MQIWLTQFSVTLNVIQRIVLGELQYYQFNFPIEICDQTHIEYEEVNSNGKVLYKPKIVLERNDPRINRHNRLQLQA